MRERLRPILDNLASFVAPGLVLLLLAIQVAFGLRGFDRPDENWLQVLQVPGVLLGWGGVALLIPLLVWMVLDWWGYDLGGFALKGLGSAVLGIATGALCGLVDDVAAGGLVGGGLAGVLRQTVGPDIAFGVLGLMAIPAAILAFSLQKRATRPERPEAVPTGASSTQTAAAGSGGTEKVRLGFWAHVRGMLGGGKGARDPGRETWYPERRFDAHGNELPMEFTRERDVGGIRFVDDEADDAEAPAAQQVTLQAEAQAEAQTTAQAVAPATTEPAAFEAQAETQPRVADLLEDEERLPTIPELLAGNFRQGGALSRDDPSGGPREDGDTPDDGPVHVGSDGRPVPAPARPTWQLAAEEPTTEAASTDADPEASDEASVGEDPVGDEDLAREDAAQQTLSFVPAREPQPLSEPALPPGVRYADEPRPPEPVEPAPEDESVEEDEPADLPALSAALEHAVRGPAADPADVAHTSRSVRETLRQKVEAIRSDGASIRYLAKLEAIGLFDSAEPDRVEEAAETAEAPGAKKAATKKAARKKAAKKKVAKKKAARKKAARKSAARRTSPATRAPSRKKAVARRKPKVDRAAAQEQKRKEALLDALRIERLDPLFARAVEAALDRGAASPVLLTRRLGLPFARAKDLVERMITVGVLEEASPSGSHAVRISAEDWAAAGA